MHIILVSVSNCVSLQEEFKSPGRRANSADRDSWPQSSSETNKTLVGLGFVISTLVVESNCAVILHLLRMEGHYWLCGHSQFALAGCEQLYLLFPVIISRNGALAQQPGPRHHRVH